MSASSTPIRKQSTEMKLVLTKDNRLTPSKASSDNSVTKTPKSVIREAPPKPDTTCAKPIVIPTIPNLLSIIKGQSTLSQFFSATLPSPQPSKPVFLQPKKSTAHPHTFSTVSQSSKSKIPPPTNSTSTHSTGTHSSGTHSTSTHSTGTHSTSTHSTVPQRAKPIMIHKSIPVSQKNTQLTLNSYPTKHKKEVPLTNKPTPQKDATGHSKASNSLALPTGGSSKDIDILQPPKAKKAKITNAPSLPLSRVKTIMKTHVQSNQNSVNIGQESVAVIARAAELFIAELGKRSQKQTKEEKTVTYTHLAQAVQHSQDMHFLHAVVPKKVLAKDFLTPSCNGANSTD